MQIEDIAISGGGSLVLGFASGYAVKKVLRFAIIVIGLFVAALAYLEYNKIISVNWVNVTSWISNTMQYISHQAMAVGNEAAGHVNAVLGIASGGFAAGFVAGIVKG